MPFTTQRIRFQKAGIGVRILALLSTALLAVFFTLAAPDPGYAKTLPTPSLPASFSELAARVSPAVVNISTVKTIKGGGRVFRHFKRNPFGNNDGMDDFFKRFFGENPHRKFKQRSLGSGFIIDSQGYIVTNNHVVEDADKIRVILKDEKEFDAKVVGRDANTDIALIKIKPVGEKLPSVKLGDSDAIKVGQWVVAIGNPFGLDHTVTAGIVSAKGRVIGSGPYDDFIQTDASINPGNSGGPLLNMQGEVIGINTAIIASGQGIGFAIPINLARPIIEQLKRNGEVVRGWLGVTIKDLPQNLADYLGIKDRKGALVIDVVTGDPADKAGIRPRDVIVEVNGKKIKNSHDLTSIVAAIGVGQHAKVSIIRDRHRKEVDVKIGKRPDTRKLAENRRPHQQQALGIQVTNITPEAVDRLNLPDDKGVLVSAVEPDSKGDQAGVQRGDVIKEINHHRVASIADYSRILSKIQSGDTVHLFVWRAKAGFLVLKLDK